MAVPAPGQNLRACPRPGPAGSGYHRTDPRPTLAAFGKAVAEPAPARCREIGPGPPELRPPKNVSQARFSNERSSLNQGPGATLRRGSGPVGEPGKASGVGNPAASGQKTGLASRCLPGRAGPGPVLGEAGEPGHPGSGQPAPSDVGPATPPNGQLVQRPTVQPAGPGVATPATSGAKLFRPAAGTGAPGHAEKRIGGRSTHGSGEHQTGGSRGCSLVPTAVAAGQNPGGVHVVARLRPSTRPVFRESMVFRTVAVSSPRPFSAAKTGGGGLAQRTRARPGGDQAPPVPRWRRAAGENGRPIQGPAVAAARCPSAPALIPAPRPRGWTVRSARGGGSP